MEGRDDARRILEPHRRVMGRRRPRGRGKLTMPLRIAVVCDAEADFWTATGLAERVLRQAGDWVREVLGNCSLWWGLQQGSFLRWDAVPSLAAERNIRSHGHFGGEPAEPDAHAARRAFRLLRSIHDNLDGVLLIRDDDRVTARRKGLEQARNDSHRKDRIVIGLAHCKRECRVLAGFDPIDEREEALLDEARQDVGFDLRLEAEQLTAKHDHDKRSAKRILAVLAGHDRDRETRCWMVASSAVLRDRGK